jgi:gliding motility-associated-like protein
MRCLYIIFNLLLFCTAALQASSQKAILVSSIGKFYEFDFNNGNCTTKELTNFCSLNLPGYSLAQHKNKVYFNAFANQLYETDLNNPGSCRSLAISANGNAMTADKNGTLYWVNGTTLYRLPNGWTQPEILGVMPFGAAGDLIFYGDKLLMAASASGGVQNFSLVEIDISSPGNSKLLMETPGYSFFGLLNIAIDCNTNKVYGISGSNTGSDIIELDIEKKVVIGKICSVPFNVFDAASNTETGEVRGVNISTVSVKPQCDGTGLGEIAVVATSANASAKLSFSNNGTMVNEAGVFTNLSAGNYLIKITSNDGCAKDTSVSVKFIERLRISTTTLPDTCGSLTGAVTISPSSNHTGFRYSLENAAYVAGNFFKGLGSGKKSLKVIETNGCVLDTNFVIPAFRPPLPVTSITINGANCNSTDGSIRIVFANGNNILGARINGGVIQASGNFFNLSAGNHQLQIITATCVYDTTVIVPQQSTPAPVVSFLTTSPDCAGKSNGSLQINLNGTVAPYTFSFNNTPFTNTTRYQNLAPGNYSITVKDAQGCVFNSTVTIQPYVAKPVTIQWLATPTDCWQKTGGKVFITVTGSEAPYFYRINNRAYQAGQEAVGLASGTYMALVSNGNNCVIDSTPVTITEQNLPGVVCDTVYVPSGFTPNADGKNDLLRPTIGSGIHHFIFRVYNRVGQVVFETNQPQKGWNGRYQGIDQPQGVYIWTFVYTGIGGQKRVFKGTTVLIR